MLATSCSSVHGERSRSRRGKGETQRQGPARHRAVSRKAVEHTARLSRAALVENPKRILFCLTRVDDDGQLAGGAPARSVRGTPPAGPRGRKVVVVVETDLADRAGQRLPATPGFTSDARPPGISRKLPRSMRMDADRKPRVRPNALDCRRLIALGSSSAPTITRAPEMPAAVRARRPRPRSAANS